MKCLSSLTLLAALLASACDGALPGVAAALSGPPGVQVSVVAEEGRPDLHLDGSAAIITALWPDAAAGDTQLMEILDPEGHLFLKERTPLDASGKARFRLPLRGSYVEDYNMTGLWQVRLSRNSALSPEHVSSFRVER